MIYFPMTADIITPGHIKCLEHLSKMGTVVVGLLTDEALEGYKTNVVPFEDRLYILEAIARGIGNIIIEPQNSLDPSHNIKLYKCKHLASGDGFEPSEEQAAKDLGIGLLDIHLAGEKTKHWSSSDVKKRLKML